MKRTIAALALAGSLLSCSAPPIHNAGGNGTLGGNDTLFVRTPDGLRSIASSTGELVHSFPGGIGSPDFTLVAAATPAGDETRISLQDPMGAELTTSQIQGSLVPRVISGTGELVALAPPRAEGIDPYLPEGRAESRIVVLNASGRHREYVLDGNFEPEAFSVNDRQLFMIEYFPALEPAEYRVRRLLLDSGKVVPIGRLKNFAPGQMQGTGRNQVYAPDGSALYTLYTQQHEGGHDHSVGGGRAFIHLLNLSESWAHCIDLPAAFGEGQTTASAIATTPIGESLFVVDWTNGAIAVVDPLEIGVMHKAEIDLGSPDEQTFAQATADTLYVGGNSTIVMIDGGSLQETDRWSLSGEIAGLKVSRDGRRLYAVVGGEIVVLNATTGEVLGSIPAPGAAGIEHVREV